ncbi:predicted protein, partial [Thalassiosira pseudonana CCMP1335]
NLIELTHLHEPSVVHALRHRYEDADVSSIYTDTGPILLAINPFKPDEEGRLYGDAIVESYQEKGVTALPPHVYAVADRTFRTMMTRLHPPKVNQSVLVSGESGAGKTVTTKLLMGYLAKLTEKNATASEDTTINDSNQENNSNMSIERRVLESNPIMESFGNARTVRNDNSSRFGKYIELKFNAPGATLVGASIETYLLEKVRLVHQSVGERNYHIFYELFSMKYEDEVKSPGDEMEDFRLINTSETYERRDGVSDADTFHDMKKAMSIMGFTPTDQHAVFGVVSALLHASNLTFKSAGEVECALDMDNPHVQFVVDLLGISTKGLNHALCYDEIVVRGETHRKVLSKDQAEKGIEALIKATYGAMFTYLVRRINASVASHTEGAVTGSVDIFGFESFAFNSFEQLCINYCNEALQQQFNGFVLRNEQEEYEREGIPWTYIEFPDNQHVLDLIDMKGTGLLNMLHDQCRTPGASDKTFALAMYERCSAHSRFEADSRQVAQQLFSIHHFAGIVQYDIDGFVEKNRDELPKEGADLLLSSSNGFVKTLAEILQPSEASAKKLLTSPRGGASQQRPTVGVQFSSQLQSLRLKIDETSPHYIRCLKPNNQLVPDLFDAALVADQLRCAGVIEAVRVSRLGYPHRYSHSRFIERYRSLGLKALGKKKTKKYNPTKALVHAISDQLGDSRGIQVGKSKVFLRRGTYDAIEKLRREKISSSTVRIQSFVSRAVYRQRFAKIRSSIIVIQSSIRIFKARRELSNRRRQHNSVILQRAWRRYSSVTRFTSAKAIARWCQVHQRGAVGRAEYNALNRVRHALCIQRYWRGYASLIAFRHQVYAAIVLQCTRRSCIARRKLSLLK